MKKEAKQEVITIKAPNFQSITLEIEGTAPLLQNKFSKKAVDTIANKQQEGTTSRTKKGNREARNYEQDYQEAQHISTEGWNGIPAPAFRSAAIRACKLVGYNMTDAKMSIFVQADGYDDDGTPLVKITKGKPEMHRAYVRLQGTTTDIRVRPIFKVWGCNIRVTFDGDQFKAQDVVNLFLRAGLQVGVGEGRPFSKTSDGLGLGTFTVKTSK
jgi:hypothetical protein